MKILKHKRVRKTVQHIFHFGDHSIVTICPPDFPQYSGRWEYFRPKKNIYYHGTIYADNNDPYTLVDIDGIYFPPQLLTALHTLHYDTSELVLI